MSSKLINLVSGTGSGKFWFLCILLLIYIPFWQWQREAAEDVKGNKPPAWDSPEGQSIVTVNIPDSDFLFVDRKGKSISFVPDYDKTLTHLLTVVTARTSPLQRGVLFTTLPDYCKLTVLTDSAKNAKKIRASFVPLLGRPAGTVDVAIAIITRDWDEFAQDMGKGTVDGFFLSRLRHQLKAPIEALGIPVYKHNLMLPGGNIRLARNRDGEQILFVGSRALEQSIEVLNKQGNTSKDLRKEVLTDYQATFNAERVIVLPNITTARFTKSDYHSGGMFHLDQDSQFIGDQLAVVLALPDPTRAEQTAYKVFIDAAENKHEAYLDNILLRYNDRTRLINAAYLGALPKCMDGLNLIALKKVLLWKRLGARHTQLRNAGFDVGTLQTTMKHIARTQSFANIIAYTHGETGRRIVMLPIYRDSTGKFFHEDPSGPIVEKGKHYDIRELNRMNYKSLDALMKRQLSDYSIDVKISEFRGAGNIHCVVATF